jgi:hypothetical protein
LPEAQRDLAKHRLNALLMRLQEVRGRWRGRGARPDPGEAPARPARGEP